MISCAKCIRGLLGAVALMGLATAPAVAELAFEGTLSGELVVPQTESTAYGLVIIITDNAMTQAAYAINFAGMDGVQTAAHFHRGAPGVNGPPIHTLPIGSPLAGIWELGPDDGQALLDGEVYLNIHSDWYPDGEIRANLQFTVLSEKSDTWGAIKSLYR